MLKLQLRRISGQAIKADFNKAVWNAFKPRFNIGWWLILLIAGLFGMTVLGNDWVLKSALFTSSPILRIIGILSASSAVGTVFKALLDWRKARAKTIDEKFEKEYRRFIEQPEYKPQMGLLSIVEEDIRWVIECLVEKNNPATIFIDDLDRCSPIRVGEVVEALNLFISGDFPGCVFIMGIDSQIIAASMEVIHTQIIEKLDDRKMDLGWRYMDKFIQLPIIIPRMTSSIRGSYINNLLQIKKDKTDIAPEVIEEVSTIRNGIEDGSLNTNEAVDKLGKISADLTKFLPETMAELTNKIIARGAREFSDKNKDMRTAIQKQAVYLTNNPRTIKRVINLYRFHYFASLGHEMAASGIKAAEPLQIARWVVAIVRWPHFVRWIQKYGREKSTNNAQLLVDYVTNMAKSSLNVESWLKELEKANINYQGWGNDRDLWNYLHEKDENGNKINISLSLASEYGLW